MSRQVIDSSVIESQLRAKGIRVPSRKPCCGRPATPASYGRYLKQLGYTGKVAIKTRGVITELVDL